MNDVKQTIDKTEDLVHKIWLAGLGAYGKGFDHVQEGYEKINDQTKQTFDDLIERGEQIEADAKSKLGESSNKLKDVTEKLKSQGDKLKVKGEQLKDDALSLNVTERLDDIRAKISDKIALPETPDFGQERLLEELNKGLEDLTSTVTNLLKGTPKADAEPAEQEAPVVAKKPAVKKPTAKKPAAKKPAVKKPAAKKPAVKKPAAKKPTTPKAPATE